eukprot:UN03995
MAPYFEEEPTAFNKMLKLLNHTIAHETYHNMEHININDEKCSICLDVFAETENKHQDTPLQVLRCGHIFHRKCILINEQTIWLNDNDTDLQSYEESTCPLCRQTYHLLYDKHNYCSNPNKGLFSSYYNTYCSTFLQKRYGRRCLIYG